MSRSLHDKRYFNRTKTLEDGQQEAIDILIQLAREQIEHNGYHYMNKKGMTTYYEGCTVCKAVKTLEEDQVANVISPNQTSMFNSKHTTMKQPEKIKWIKTNLRKHYNSKAWQDEEDPYKRGIANGMSALFKMLSDRLNETELAATFAYSLHTSEDEKGFYDACKNAEAMGYSYEEWMEDTEND